MNGHGYQYNVFGRLFSYRNRPGKTSEEDFLTEAYATVLLSDKGAAARVLQDLWGVAISPCFLLSTQRQYGGNRPDMEIADDKHLVFQENKVGADFGELQIEGYQDCVQEVATQRKLEPLVISCTPLRSAPSGNATVRHIHHTWSDVYTAVQKHVDQVADASRRLWSDFLDFLEAKGMKPFTGLRQESLSAFAEVARLRRQLVQMLDEVYEHLQARYRVRLGSSKQSSNRWYVDKCGLIAEGPEADGLIINPWIEFVDDGKVYLVLRLFGTIMQKVLQDDVCRNAFLDAGYGNYDARLDLATLLEVAPDGDAVRQREFLMRRVDETLESLERLGILELRLPRA